MVFHYVIEHRYRPPDEFIAALEQCPPRGSPEFLALIAPFREHCGTPLVRLEERDPIELQKSR